MKLYAKIISPIHIRSGDEWTGLDYKLDGENLKVLDFNWLASWLKSNPSLEQDFLRLVERGEFNKILDLKQKYKIDPSLEKQSIKVSPGAKNQLNMVGNKNNQGIIKQFVKNPISGENYIPGSSLKGMIKSIISIGFRLDRNLEYKNFGDKKDLDDLIEVLGKNISCKDEKIKNPETKIILATSKTKPKKQSYQTKGGLPILVEAVVGGEFEISIYQKTFEKNIEKFDFDIEQEFGYLIQDYSQNVINIEKNILSNIKNNKALDFLNSFEQYKGKDVFPIKIGMFKKSGTYKVFWDEILDEGFYDKDGHHKIKVYENGNSKIKKSGVGDKSISLDENDLPMGWILISKNPF